MISEGGVGIFPGPVNTSIFPYDYKISSGCTYKSELQMISEGGVGVFPGPVNTSMFPFDFKNLIWL